MNVIFLSPHFPSHLHNFCRELKRLGANVLGIGDATVKAFGLRNRFFHLEFFRLDETKRGLGKKGEVLGLEANLRAPGGYIPDKMNYAFNTDVYRIWAETLVKGTPEGNAQTAFVSYVSHFARGARVVYRHSLEDIRGEFAGAKYLYDRTPPAKLAGGMGSLAVLLRAESVSEIHQQAEYILQHA